MTEPNEPPQDPVSLPPRRRRGPADDDPHATRRRLMIVLPLVMAAAAISVVVLEGLKDSSMYVKTVDRVLAEKSRFVGREVRAEGLLVEGSMVKRESPCEYRFHVMKNDADVAVRYPKCSDFPDALLAEPDPELAREVTMEGTLQADDTFLATRVLAKCPTKYTPEQMKRGRPKANASVMR